MSRAWFVAAGVLAVVIAGIVFWAEVRVRASALPSRAQYRSEWSPAAAAGYLDSREMWWQEWPHAQRDQGTVCISCHTVLPYALARPALRAQLHQGALTMGETKMLDSIEKRVADWQHLPPYYTDAAHAAPSHATESVLNALILAIYSQQDASLRPVAQQAFDEAWALQETTGANAGGWQWQDFHEAPWESPESVYQGAAMMAIAVGVAGDSYGADRAGHDRIARLDDYLIRHYPAQPLLNRLYVLWASAKVPGLLPHAQRAELLQSMAKSQQPDGGWSLPSLDPQHAPKKAFLDFLKRANDADASDGCATGLTVLAMEEAGVNPQDPMLQRGVAWLARNQDQEGSWWASSLNGFRDPASDMGRFMSDAATGYSVIALEEAQARNSAPLPARAPGAPSARSGD